MPTPTISLVPECGCVVSWRWIVTVGVMLGFLIFDGLMRSGSETRQAVEIISGDHAGRTGNVVSMPWIGNIWNLRLTVNVAATEREIHEQFPGWGNRVEELVDAMKQDHGPRAWLCVWRWQVRAS